MIYLLASGLVLLFFFLMALVLSGCGDDDYPY